MDRESIKEKLESLGIPTDGSWKDVKAKKGAMPKVVGEQAQALREIEKILQKQLESDKKEVANLHAALQRLKNGGGS